MSSAVAALLHAIGTGVKIVPREKSGTKRFAWTDSHDSSIILYNLYSSTIYVKIKFFHWAVPELHDLKSRNEIVQTAYARGSKISFPSCFRRYTSWKCAKDASSLYLQLSRKVTSTSWGLVSNCVLFFRASENRIYCW